MPKRKLKDPFAQLQDIDQRARKSAELFSGDEYAIQQTQAGIGFRLNDMNMVAPLAEIAEIIGLPQLSRVPGAAKWIVGVTSLRGRLVPVVDTQAFIGMDPTPVLGHSRIFVVGYQDMLVGFLVNGVSGLAHYRDEDLKMEMPVTDKAIAPYLRGAFLRNNRHWGIISLRTLMQNPRFYQVAA